MIAIFESLEHLNTAIPLPPETQTLDSGIVVVSESKRVLPSGTQLMGGVTAEDGRIAISHAFSEEDVLALKSVGAVVVESLPDDWYPQPEFTEVIVPE